MSQSVITSAFAEWKAQQAVDNKPVVLDEFVFANIPNLDITNPIDPAEGMPPAARIVHRQAVGKSGMVNQNAVVYSVVMGADVGDFDFNWIGIINKASGVVATIIHAPTQRKVKNNSGQQGNVLTRSILMEYSGARTETQIEVPAETWQIDFTARLAGMDERQRVENVDIYGPGAFFGNGFLVTKSGTAYSIAAGVGYVGGLRAQLAAATAVAVTNKPVRVWVDVVWKGTLTSVWGVECVVTVAANLADYVKDGQQHYVFAVASIDAAGNVTDLRPKGSLTDQSGASAYTRKDRNLSDLDSIPKARETLKLKGAALLDVGTAAGTVAAGDDSRIVNAVPNTRKVNGHPLTNDFDLSAADVKALAVTNIRAQRDPSLGNVADANDLPANATSFVYSNVTNAPPFTGSLLDFSGAGNGYNVNISASYNGAGERIAFRTRNGDAKAWNSWHEIYHTGNKPSAADVDAIPDGSISGGPNAPAWNAKSGMYNLSVDGASQMIFHLNQRWGSCPSAQFRFDYKNRGIWYRSARDKFGFEADWSELLTHTGSLNITGPLRSSAEYQATKPDNFRIAYNGYGVFWRNDGIRHYLMVTNKNDIYGGYNSLRPFYVDIATGNVALQHNVSVGGPLSCNSTITPGNYSNFDARYFTQAAANARYVTGVRLGARGQITTDGNMTEAPRGCVITGGNGNEGNQIGYMYYRPLQQLINGTWVTVAYA
ncbi:phage tail protein [Erwinia aphidicola]|uniref:phage tail-collar fiber domain-containing protein n=1 Tax=Erwinia aphidicola TaxID=68334 RepID=UPI0030CB5C71